MKTIPMSYCKKRLAILWFTAFILIFMIILLQTVSGKYEDQFEDVWSWLSQNTLPTLSLIVSTFVVDVIDRPTEEKKVDDFYYQFCFWGCFIYLFILLLTILSEPFALENIKGLKDNELIEITTLEYLKKSNNWLSPLQALVSVLLGVFFIKKSEK